MAKRQPVLEFKGFLSFLLLHELSKKSQYGEELAASIGLRRGEPLTPGTIYPALKRLMSEDLVERSIDGRKKIYSLTAQGKKELKLLYKLFGAYFSGLRMKIPAPNKKEKKKSKRKAHVQKN